MKRSKACVCEINLKGCLNGFSTINKRSAKQAERKLPFDKLGALRAGVPCGWKNWLDKEL